MVQAPSFLADLTTSSELDVADLSFQLPDPEDEQLLDHEFHQQIETAWQVCDRFDLQTDIWRGRILRTVRDREKAQGESRGSGFLNWLKDREISKSQAYSWMELADSADALLEGGYLEPDSINRFSKRAFVEAAHSAPEVQQIVGEAARNGEHITRREVRQVSDEWTAMTSELLPPELKEKAASNVIPTRYLPPLVKEMEKLPELQQAQIREAVAENPDLDTVKQITAEARSLSKYLTAAAQVQSLNRESLDLEQALEEAFRLDCLSSAADLVSQAAQLEQLITKVYATWKRINTLSERLYLDSGASTPHLRSLLDNLTCLSGEVMEIQLGNLESSRTIRLQIQIE